MSTSTSASTVGTDAVFRIFNLDYTLWPEPAEGDGGHWLGWLDLPNYLVGDHVLPTKDELNELKDVEHVVVLGMGGSSLTVAVLADIFDGQHGKGSTKRLTALDTANPRTVRDFLANNDITKCHFIVSSKSGTTIEPLSLEAIFRRELEKLGFDTPSRFTAISDRNTPLARRALSGEFRKHVSTPSNVGGRFSALSDFGMYPARLCGLPVREMGSCASEMRFECMGEPDDNPGYSLGRFLADNAASGRDKLTILPTKSLETIGLWIEQLVAESTGKSGTGLVPVVGEPNLPLDYYGDDRQFVSIALESDEPNPLVESVEPLYELRLSEPCEIAAEFYRWEIAIAVASAGLGVYPFDQPNVESAKQFAREVLEGDGPPNVKDEALPDAMKSLMEASAPGRYVALCAFLPESPALTDAFSNLRQGITRITGMATTFGYGPRYLHSTGQLHKGGSDSVSQVVLVQDDSESDVAVPGRDYSLGQLIRAQAVGDVMAMRDLGRQSRLVLLREDPVAEINKVAMNLCHHPYSTQSSI